MGIRRNASSYGSAISDEAVTVAGTAIQGTTPTGAVAAMVTNGGTYKNEVGYSYCFCGSLH